MTDIPDLMVTRLRAAALKDGAMADRDTVRSWLEAAINPQPEDIPVSLEMRRVGARALLVGQQQQAAGDWAARVYQAMERTRRDEGSR